jgi:sulfite reductase (ferredoxin)
MNTLYKDLVPASQIVTALRPILDHYKQFRHANESLGDFCHRVGVDQLLLLDSA